MNRVSTSLLITVGILFNASVVQALVMDDFESYNTTGELAAAWVDGAGNASQNLFILGSPFAEGGDNSLQFNYDMDLAPMFDEVIFDYGVDQDWSSFTTFEIYYLGDAGNASNDIYFSLFDQFGGELGSAILVGGTLPTTYQLWSVDISGFSNVGNGTDLSDVRTVHLGIQADAGSPGLVWFDTFTLVPEPSTALLLGIGIVAMATNRRPRSKRA